jgi:hypothetical protein
MTLQNGSWLPRENTMKSKHRVGFFLVFSAAFLLVAFGLLSQALAQNPPTLSGCPVFPSNNIWNTPIDTMPVDVNSSQYIATIGATVGVHPDFGSGLWAEGPIGIPYNIVAGSQPKVPISFDYAEESDPGPYPIPPDAAIEGGSQSTGDRHILVADRDNCMLYETWSTYPQANGSWTAGSGAVFNLRSNALRPSTWTSSDAAGLPVLPGLLRYDEVAAGAINHAIRFTVPQTRKAFIWPARHYASSLTGLKYPPMGQRFRLKASFNISGFAPEVQVILKALKKYGMILADNGSAWFISGVPDSRWNNDTLVNQLKLVKGSDFEAIDESSLMVDPDSGQAGSGPSTLNPNPPDQPVRLIFIHHSTGENWLADSNGRLAIALQDNNYYVSDTNYGWGPDGIGDQTDIGDWWLWFRGPSSGIYMSDLYAESSQHASYSRMGGTPPGNENEVVLFKSCFPNSALQGNPGDPVPLIDQNQLRGENSSSPYHTVANAKGIYTDILEYFRTRQDKLFIAITAPPLSDGTYAANARAFNEWLMHDWLKDYPYDNVAVFDFYNVLTTNGGSASINDLGLSTGNHHRWWQNVIQHKIDGDNDGNPNVLEYPNGDDHPSTAGNLKATGEFPALLNIFYHCWKGTGGCPGEPPPEQPVISVTPASRDFGSLYVGNVSVAQNFTIANTGAAVLLIGTVALAGQSGNEFLVTFDGCSGQVLDPSETCTVSVAFSPTSAGAKSATLNIPSSDPLKPQVTVPLSGTAQQATTITVVSPNGAETWEAGTTQTIRWQFTGSPGSYVKILLLKNGTSVRTITSQTGIGAGGNGSYSWAILKGQTPGADYRIKIISTKSSSYNDTSNGNFSIAAPPPPSITVVSPNGGQSWQIGTKQLIQWSYTGNPGSFVKIQLIQTQTNASRSIINSTPIGSNQAGSYSWLLPPDLKPGTTYKVRVTSTTNTAYKDESDAIFSIRK